MSKTIEAVYKNGVFRPLEPVTLPEGERVHVTVPEATAEIQRRLAEFAREDAEGQLQDAETFLNEVK